MRLARAGKPLAVLFGLLLCAGALEFGRRARAPREAASDRGYRILFIGMSTTIGRPGSSYPAEVERILDEKFGDRFEAVNEGDVGTTVVKVAEKLEPMLDRVRPRVLVSLFPEGPGKGTMVPGTAWFETSPVFAGMRRRKPALLKNLPKDPPDPVTEEKVDGVLAAAWSAFLRGDRSGSAKIVDDGMRAFPEEARLPLARALMLALDGAPEQAERYARIAKGLPQAARTYMDWANYHSAMGRPSLQVTATENALMLNEASISDLASACIAGGDGERGDRLLEEAMARNPSTHAMGMLATRRFKQGRFAEADKLYARANAVRRMFSNFEEHVAYAKVAKILRRRGVAWVCVQIPVRGVASLKRLAGEDRGAVFVDNEMTFKDEMKKVGFERLFEDTFLGDAGHLTPRGNRLLAENVAAAIERADPGLAAGPKSPE